MNAWFVWKQCIFACGTVSIAEMNWASAQLMANVDKIILESGYGCKVDIVPGDTMPTFTSMNEKGQPDVAGELWVNAVATPLNAAKAEGRLHTVSEGPITGLGEGWWLLPHACATTQAGPQAASAVLAVQPLVLILIVLTRAELVRLIPGQTTDWGRWRRGSRACRWLSAHWLARVVGNNLDRHRLCSGWKRRQQQSHGQANPPHFNPDQKTSSTGSSTTTPANA